MEFYIYVNQNQQLYGAKPGPVPVRYEHGQ